MIEGRHPVGSQLCQIRQVFVHIRHLFWVNILQETCFADVILNFPVNLYNITSLLVVISV